MCRRPWIDCLLVIVSLQAPFASPHATAQPDDKRTRAIEALEHGVALYRRGAYDAALAEFLRSRSLYPARGNTLNAALCLAKLDRSDEALDMFETLLREENNLSARERALVEEEVAALRRRVGSVEVRILEPGATIVIGGRQRGTTPLSAPIRVTTGSHVVRVFKQGFAPHERLVDVAGEQQVVVAGRLEPLENAGQLTVTTQDGKVADVIVDNVPVGRTPWRGRVQIGRHTVRLRGAGRLGTAPVAADVRADSVTPLVLELVALACELRVAPTPANARIAIDGIDVGLGAWMGALRCGQHDVELAAPGFVTARRRVDLVRGPRRELRIALDRDPDSEEFARANPPHVVVEAFAAPLFLPSLGGDVSATCVDACSSSVPLGVIASAGAGYQLGLGLGFGAEVGYLQLGHETRDRTITVYQVPNGAPLAAVSSDERLLRAAVLGASAWFRRGEPWSFTGRLGGGVALGSMHTQRSSAVAGENVIVPEQSTAARYVYVTARVGVGYQPIDTLEIAIAFQAGALFAITQPSWRQETEAFTQSAGFLSYGDETLTGEAIWTLSPGLAAILTVF